MNVFRWVSIFGAPFGCRRSSSPSRKRHACSRRRRQRRRRCSTADLDHHRTTMVGYGRPCGRHFRAPSPFRWLAPDRERERERRRSDCRSRLGTCPSRHAILREEKDV
ncbi:hypothetical protein PUN28_015549 [Cardiocondyla obscurior]|uniref:Secreted protein n=1 Tax=Cardiocondyla obscurior TaxID=286306 RepID=A0AAW2EXE8_9HYME